jgi:HlyD family type I secretion membrane fusion protein
MAMASRAEQTINESKIDIINQRTDFLNKVVADLKDTQLQLSTLEEQGRASADVVRRIDVTAPIAGTVTGLAIHTIGGVIQPGETMMTLVPSDDRLVVEAHVSPQDIDAVHAGLIAQVRLTAFKMRYLRPVKGTVQTVSADRFDDQKTNDSYYIARIEIPQSELADIGNRKLTPGMPAEALIVTGHRTMLSYLVHPIRESFGHAFHDQ